MAKQKKPVHRVQMTEGKRSNGYKRKRVNSSYGAMEIEVPQDRKSTFEPQVVKTRQKDICNNMD